MDKPEADTVVSFSCNGGSNINIVIGSHRCQGVCCFPTGADGAG